jgi:hypothetical protein
LRRIGFVFGRFDPSRDFLVGSSANEIFYKVILAARPTSGFTDHQTGAGKMADGLAERYGLLPTDDGLIF